MKIFILEDSPDRMAGFSTALITKHVVQFGTDLVDAKASFDMTQISGGQYGLLLLDHDLGDNSEGTGLDFCKWLMTKERAKKGFFNIQPVIIIHSWNIEGALSMESYLKEMEWYRVYRIEYGTKLLALLEEL